MKLVFNTGEVIEFTAVVIKTKYVSIVRNNRKFYLINNKNVTEGKEWVCPKDASD